MSQSVFNMIDELLSEPVPQSWHETARRDLGIPEECAAEPLLCLSLQRAGLGIEATPLAFVVEDRHIGNTLTALCEFMREAFHPTLSSADVIGLLDFLPPLDEFGAANGISRRWVMDRFNYGLVLPEVSAYLRTIARGL